MNAPTPASRKADDFEKHAPIGTPCVYRCPETGDQVETKVSSVPWVIVANQMVVVRLDGMMGGKNIDDISFVPSEERTEYTIAELDHACRWVFNFDSRYSTLIKSCGRVTTHHIACENAFVDGMAGPNVAILRQALRDLKRTGQYRPVDGVFPDEALAAQLDAEDAQAQGGR